MLGDIFAGLAGLCAISALVIALFWLAKGANDPFRKLTEVIEQNNKSLNEQLQALTKSENDLIVTVNRLIEEIRKDRQSKYRRRARNSKPKD